MVEPLFSSYPPGMIPPGQFAGLNNQRSQQPPQAAPASGYFSTNSKYLFVGALLWSGIAALAACAWLGVWQVGVNLAHWLAR